MLLGLTLGLGPVPAPATAKAAAKPTVTKVGPRAGATAGGYDVAIKGSGFKNVKKVLFDDAKARDVRVRTGSRLVVEAPPHAAGVVTVKVVTKAGASAKGTKAQFTLRRAGRAATAARRGRRRAEPRGREPGHRPGDRRHRGHADRRRPDRRLRRPLRRHRRPP